MAEELSLNVALCLLFEMMNFFRAIQQLGISDAREKLTTKK